MTEGVYTPEEVGALLKVVEPNISMALLILGTLSLTVFFMFKSQRKFPTCILAWLVIFNVLNDIWLVIKWTNAEVANSLTKNLNLCNFSIWVDVHHQSNTVTINTLMTFSLFVLLRLHKDIDYDTNPYYLWAYMAVVAFVPATIALIVTLLGPPQGVVYNCLSELPIVLVYSVTVAFLICVQIVFLILISAEMFKIINAVKNTAHSKRDIRLVYMISRFSMSVLAQIVQISGLYVFSLMPSYKINLINSVVWTSPIGELLDALILFFGNQHMWRWLARKKNSMSSSGESSDTTVLNVISS